MHFMFNPVREVGYIATRLDSKDELDGGGRQSPMVSVKT